MIIDYWSLLLNFYPDDEWVMDGDTYDALVWYSDGDAPSQAELDAAWPQFDYQRQYTQVEAERRARYQIETDGMFFAAQRDGGDLVAWEAAVAAIKADLPYPDAP